MNLKIEESENFNNVKINESISTDKNLTDNYTVTIQSFPDEKEL